MATVDLSTVVSRAALEPRSHEYFQSLGGGAFLGFYRSPSATKPDTWCGRWRDPKTGKQHRTRFEDVQKLPPAKQFAAAQDALIKWHGRLVDAMNRAEVLGVPLGAVVSETVGDALRSYLTRSKEKDMPTTLMRLVLGGQGKHRSYPEDPLALVKLSSPNLAAELTAWRGRIGKGRKVTAVNRDLVPIRSALNYEVEYILSRRWRDALKPGVPEKAEAGEALGVYRPREEREAVLAEMCPLGRAFYTMLARLPLRPGAVADLNVRDFKKASGELTIGYDKKHPRTLALPEGLVDHLRLAAGRRAPLEPMFVAPNGQRWMGKLWDQQIKAAALVAGTKRAEAWADSASWSAYDFRHSTITDLIEAGIPISSVAKVAGTSPEMIYKRYHHLLDRNVAKVLAVLE